MTATIDCDVLIVGAGPTGVTLGVLLARTGAKTLVIDKEADIYPLPRAAHIDHEVMRILQEVGVAGEIEATSRSASRYDFLSAKGEILLRFEGADAIGPGGWRVANMIHQPTVEAALARALAAEKNATLRRRWAFQSFETKGGRAVARVGTPEGEATVTARYIIGADGARSPVRNAAGIAFDDLEFDEPWLVIDVLVSDPDRLPDVNLQICDPERPTTCVLMSEGRHRWEFMIKPGETAEEVLDDEFIKGLLRPWKVDGAVTLERKAVYRFNARVASAWRKGAVLLAGDAAHQMPPFAGQGFCSGLRDAANLAWKLGAVLQGADARLLDAYQPEREPHVRFIINMSMMMGRTVCITDREAAAARDKDMLAARAAGVSPDGAIAFPTISEGCIMSGATAAGGYFPQFTAPGSSRRLDDALGAGAALISRSAAPTDMAGLRAFSLDDPRLQPFAADVGAWLAARGADAVLIRPDRYIFGAGEASALCDAWRRAVQ